MQMLSSSLNVHKQTTNDYIKIKGKEADSILAYQITNLSHTYPKRASAFTSKKASITIEAAAAFPLFFFAMLALLYLLEIMSIQMSIRGGLHYACKEYAENAYSLPFVMPAKIESEIVEAVGSDRINRSIISGGSAGIHAIKSAASPTTGVLNCEVTYDMRLPIFSFGKLTMPGKITMRIKGWTGYVKGGFGEQKEDTVYITETGIVYHKNYQCTYLDLSIQMVPFEGVKDMRNEGQEKYYPCEHCANGAAAQGVYITNTGNRYHNALSCSGLKRSIYAVAISEVGGRGLCSRCAQP